MAWMRGGSDGPSLQGAPERLGDEAMGGIIRGGIPGTGMNGFGSLSADETGQVIGYLRTLGHTADAEIAKGDPAKGKTVYESSGCAGCHIISGEGGGVGPELTRVGAMRGPSYLRTTLLTPGAILPKEGGAMERGRFTQFLFVHVVTKDGRSVRRHARLRGLVYDRTEGRRGPISLVQETWNCRSWKSFREKA